MRSNSSRYLKASPSRTSHRRSTRRRILRLESLENRRVLASVSLADDGVLTIEGDDDANRIAVWTSRDRQTLRVSVDGRLADFRNDRVELIEVNAGSGNDQVRLSRNVLQASRLNGQAGNDRLQGGSGPNLMQGGAGDDLITGGARADILFGGMGRDRIRGGRGDDYLIGGSDHDALSGGRGNDWVFGDATDSYPDGAVDPVAYALEFANSNRGRDQIVGGPGNDVLLGGNGDDVIQGQQGNDILVGGTGSDRLSGGDGDDAILGDQRFADESDASDGPPVLSSSPFLAALRSGSAPEIETEVPVDPTFDDVMTGGDGDDWIWGMQGDDHLVGGAGDDVLRGGQGRDRLRGNDGEDLLVGGDGRDDLRGGRGADIIRAADGVVDYILTDGFDDLEVDPEDIVAIF
ncbi:MAG: calcium-binding protein [Planctomycetota bacterium]